MPDPEFAFVSSVAGAGGLSLSAGDLFMVAWRARERMGAGGAADLQALVAIVFSAAALEGFINEVTAQAEQFTTIRDEPSVGTFAALSAELEQARASTRAKFQVAHLVFTGRRYDKGVSPYQDFTLLFGLRDVLMHRKPEVTVPSQFSGSGGVFYAIEPHQMVEKLRSKGVLAGSGSTEPFSPSQLLPLTRLVNTEAAAEWACATARSMVRSLVEILPRGPFRMGLEQIYASSFGL